MMFKNCCYVAMASSHNFYNASMRIYKGSLKIYKGSSISLFRTIIWTNEITDLNNYYSVQILISYHYLH